MRKALCVPGHGMFAHEAEIMDAWDAGLSRAQIAAKLGMTTTRVKNVINTYDDTETDRWATRARMASMRLADAIAAL